jgi:hypothetical protein
VDPARLKCCLKKALYGLRQAPRAWYAKLRTTLAALGLKPSKADAALYVADGIYVLAYVDDILLAGTRVKVDAMKKALQNTFKVTDLAPASFFPCMEIRRDRT